MDLKLIKTKDIKELKEQLKNIDRKNTELLDEWLSTAQATEFLKVGKKTLKRYRDAGKLAYSKDGRKIRYKKSDLINYLNKNYFSVETINK